MRIRRRAALFGALPAAAAAAQPAPSAVLVELFTSQSCSSCPPAEDLLRELIARRPDVLALELHVTYWDRLGWKDPFSLEAATARQQRYSRLVGRDHVYTPQMVVQGVHQFVGSDRSGAYAAIARAGREQPARVPVRVEQRGGAIEVEIGVGAGEGAIWLAGFDRAQVTQVRGGENAGRRLMHANVVRALRPIGAWSGAAARFAATSPPGDRVVVWVEDLDGRILGFAATA